MPYIANKRSTIKTEIVMAKPGDNVRSCIDLALSLVAQAHRAYAYFNHNGVIITVDKTSTAESAYEDWNQRAVFANDTFCNASGIE